MRTELDTVDKVQEWVLEHGHLEEVLVRDLDLTGLVASLGGVSTHGSVFMGCLLGQGMAEAITSSGGMVFPALDGVPYHPYRQALYTPDELLEGLVRGDPESFWRDTVDSRIYRHYQALKHTEGPLPVLAALGMRLHDHAMDRAMREWLDGEGEPLQMVGIMGGHALRRDHADYARVAHLSQKLAAAGYTVATGGGPGAMEAANLGAWMAPWTSADLDHAIQHLRGAVGWRSPAWIETALAVRDRYPGGAESLGVPTWFYGHEPTNLFATHVAKYFANSLREDGLLAIALHGVVYSPGSAGTVQEIFQDAAQNHYGTFQWISPMVLMDQRYWTEELPVLELLSCLSRGRDYADYLHISDDIDEIVTFVQEHPPLPWPPE